MRGEDTTETQNSTIWPHIMTRAGDRADYMQMEEAWVMWLRKKPQLRTYSSLAWCLVKVCMNATQPIHIYAYNRVADAMLQIARKKGVIETMPGTRTWRLIKEENQ